MSQFINGSYGLPVTIHAANDYSVCDSLYFGPRSRAPSPFPPGNELIAADSQHQYQLMTFATPWWPRTTQILGGWSGSTDDNNLNLPPQWIGIRIARGCNGRLGYVGYTRDQFGSALGACTVRCYRVSTEEQVAKVTSDANGLYFATTPYSDAHFLVIHNATGTLAGATKDSLLPA